MKRTTVTHQFIDILPTPLLPGVVYVSIRFTTVAHLCCCGCGNEVVTPLSPARWQLRFDGRSVSLHPSIGNWTLPCRSHYWILNNTVRWAENWSDARVTRAIAATGVRSSPMDQRSGESPRGLELAEVVFAPR